MGSSLVCLSGCLGTLCGYGGCGGCSGCGVYGDCYACTVVLLDVCMLRECEGAAMLV